MECLEPPSLVQRLKGYASDSTVTVSTHKRRKIRTRKISHKSSESAAAQKKLNDLMKSHKLFPGAVHRSGKVKPDIHFKPHTATHPKLTHERWSQLRDKNHRLSRQDREKRWSRQLKPSRDWQAIAELPPTVLNSRIMNRSHSFSSDGELLGLAKQQDKPTHRHSSGKWTVYGFI